ncbi:helix-turn-helix domain-containing protein [Streptomyces meridianus]|uniref:Helix-turn-helix domain-containing protein n=1 Tax=Streptomyces meridianus TaxID=2938945 RepID=A0ABT0X8U6_9ACTN|nr:helix-turn-helix domain-containing protein [Streptomyces meridianus]MCM2578947.1 helix-turn-helix domain-containing protein [Streptomyces meridianus]
MTQGYHSTWRIPEEHRADPAYVEAGDAIALGQAVHDRRTALELTQQQLAENSGLSVTEIERIEGGAVTPTLALLHALARALDARLALSIEADETQVSFEAHAA